MDNESEVNTMSNETLTEIRDSLSRVLKHIEEEPETEEVVKTDQVEDNGAIAYIDTLEKFAHESGVNLDALRGHFGLEKAYLQEGSGGYSHRGQGDMEGSGESASEPSYPALPSASGNQNVIKQTGSMDMNAPSGNKNVIKSGLNLSPDSLERGYRAYAAIRDEEAVKSLVEKEWKDRYNAETEQALELQKANDFGGQINSLRAEIASLKQENSSLQKSVVAEPATTSVRVPTHDEFAAMGNGVDGWLAAEDLARRALRGE